MKIVIIGSGNVASVLGRLFVKNNHEILQVVSRNAAHAQALAAEFDCGFADYEGAINKEADLYLVAVVDSALYDCILCKAFEKKWNIPVRSRF